MMRRFVVVMMIGLGLPCSAVAQGTKLWSVDRYDAMEKETLATVGALAADSMRKLRFLDVRRRVEATNSQSTFYLSEQRHNGLVG